MKINAAAINSAINILDLKINKDIISTSIDKYVPYIYLDGHRSGAVGLKDSQAYSQGIKFFFDLVNISHQLGIKNVVVMIHTERNSEQRVQAVVKAILQNILYISSKSFKILYKVYGNLDRYDGPIISQIINVIKNDDRSNKNCITCHILLNYSEKWAVSNIESIKKIPDISTIIRFTKGHYSGGWIPLKMSKTLFIYVQNPSLKHVWSTSDILLLLLISFDNWFYNFKTLGNINYTNEIDKNEVYTLRDKSLLLREKKINKEIKPKRIICFDLYGPMIYEI